MIPSKFKRQGESEKSKIIRKQADIIRKHNQYNIHKASMPQTTKSQDRFESRLPKIEAATPEAMSEHENEDGQSLDNLSQFMTKSQSSPMLRPSYVAGGSGYNKFITKHELNDLKGKDSFDKQDILDQRQISKSILYHE